MPAVEEEISKLRSSRGRDTCGVCGAFIGIQGYKENDIKVGRNYETRSTYAPLFIPSKCKRPDNGKNSVYTACQLVVCSPMYTEYYWHERETEAPSLYVAMNKHR